MKKIICGSALLLVATCGYVHAQSSVTIYGVIDAGVTYFNNLNGFKTVVAQDGSIQANRLGFRGTEDLGGGTSAVFVLENGFNLGTGGMVQPGVLFSRMSYVGINDNQYGSLTLGKQYDFFWDNLTQFSMGQRSGQYSWHPGDFDHLAGTLHINNAIKYTSAPYKDFNIGALYATPSQDVSAGTGRVIAFGARYGTGTVRLGLAYTATHNLGLNAPAQAGTTLFPTLPASPVLASKVSTIGAGGSYTMGNFTTRMLFTATTFHIGNNSGTMPTYEINEIFAASPAASVSGGVWYSKIGTQSWKNATLTYDYSLSKRTDVYVTGAYLRTGGGAAPVFLGGGSSPVFSNGVSIGSGSSATALRIGIRTMF